MADSSVFQVSFPEPDIALLTLDDPAKGANVLSTNVLRELSEHLDALEKRKGLAGLVIQSGKPGQFIAGADLREFMQWIDSPPEEVAGFCRLGQALFMRLAAMPFVTVAAIDGICVGGGAELALWCDRRIMSDSDKTQYGFPEVKLGLFPGWGGASRTPRIVGLANAVEMVTGGESIDARTAATMGLASDVVPADRLEKAAIALIRAEQKSGQYKLDRQRWAGPLDIDETELGFLGATASSYIQQHTKGQYPAPLVVLELMLGAAGGDVKASCEMEAENFSQVFGTPVNRSLLNIFFLQDRNKKDTGIETPGVEPRKIGSVSVIGAGIMGQGIAAANLRRKIVATLTDTNTAALATGVSKVLEEVSYSKHTKGPDVHRALEFAPLINGTVSDAEVAASDVVIEAVVENPAIKKKVYARLEGLLRDDAILASNTSTIPISQLASELKRPERFVGIHFFNPVRQMPLVEVIRGAKTSDATVATSVAYVKAIGKTPIVVNDGPGFLVNRLLLPYMNEALELVCEGASLKAVDRAAKSFGMPMGPITLFDVVGLDIALHAGAVMHESFPERVVASPLLQVMYNAQRLGQKNGLGFFNYQRDKKRGEPDPAVDALIESCRRDSRKFSEEELTMRLLLPMLVEATRILEERLVRDVRDVDLGLIYGIGFPPFRGGLLFWADTLGAKKILELLAPLEKIGPRYQPTKMLQAMAKSGQKFYQ